MKLVFVALAAALMAPPAAHAFRWPGHAKAAVSLAYDDALDSQLDNALPGLDRYGLKGSFYLQLSNPAVQLRMGEWRAAAQRGHELATTACFTSAYTTPATVPGCSRTATWPPPAWSR